MQAEDQTSRVMSNQAIRRTTHSMTVALLARRNLSIGDIPIIKVSDSSAPRPSLVPFCPAFLDLKYVSLSRDNVDGTQQVNHECGKEIDQKSYLGEEDRKASNMESKEQIDQNPHARVISSLQTDLKEAQVIQTIAMEEITSLKS